MDTAQEFRGLTTPRRQPAGEAPYLPVEFILDTDGDLRIWVKGSGGIAGVQIHASDVPAVRDWLRDNVGVK